MLRAAGWVAFAAALGPALSSKPYPDVIIATTSPPTVPAVCAMFGKAPLVVWCMDVYPEVLVAAGITRQGSFLHRGLGACARSVDRRARMIVTMGDEMLERIAARGAPREWIRSIPPWVLPSPSTGIEITPKDRFTVAYLGTLGIGHDWAAIAGAMEQLKESRHISWTITGGGCGHDRLRQFARAHSIHNVAFKSFVPEEELTDLSYGASMHVVSLDPGFDGLMYPSKLSAACAAGRPVAYIGSFGSEIGRLLTESRAGVVVEPGDGQGLSAAIRRYSSDAALWRDSSERAKTVAASALSRTTAMRRWSAIIDECRVGNRTPLFVGSARR
jgi:colanic acid biosynthesis glycosyl transferase WcaI